MCSGKGTRCVCSHTLIILPINRWTGKWWNGTHTVFQEQCSQEPSGGPQRAPAAPLTPHAPQQTGLWVQHLVFSPTYLLDGSWVNRSQHGFTARGHQISPCSVSLGLCSRPDEAVVTSCRLYPFLSAYGTVTTSRGLVFGGHQIV